MLIALSRRCWCGCESISSHHQHVWEQPTAAYSTEHTLNTSIHMSISNAVREFNCIQNIHTRCARTLLLFISEKCAPSSYHYYYYILLFCLRMRNEWKRTGIHTHNSFVWKLETKCLHALASTHFGLERCLPATESRKPNALGWHGGCGPWNRSNASHMLVLNS